MTLKRLPLRRPSRFIPRLVAINPLVRSVKPFMTLRSLHDLEEVTAEIALLAHANFGS